MGRVTSVQGESRSSVHAVSSNVFSIGTGGGNGYGVLIHNAGGHVTNFHLQSNTFANNANVTNGVFASSGFYHTNTGLANWN